MKLNSGKKQVEVLLDDHDLNELLNNRQVRLMEIGVNDSRPMVISRWVNPELKVLNRNQDLRAIEMLTGQNPMEALRENRVKEPPKPMMEPFSIERKENALKKSNETIPFSDSREKPS
jgi:hypothetical protein